MLIQKSHFWGLALIAAMAGSYVVQREENVNRATEDRDVVIDNCERTAQRAAITAAGFKVLQERVGARDTAADKKSSDLYGAVSVGLAETLPVEAGVDHGRAILVNVIETPDGTLRFQLTESAQKLQSEGCRHAYE